jgi:dephospho-CoA kinase
MNYNSKTCLTIGVTGGIGSGKSTVCKIIESLGYPVFYSDLESKKLMLKDSAVIQEVRSLFGDDAYLDGELNRSFLASKVFRDKTLLAKLNDIIHPAVREAFAQFSQKYSEKKLVFNEAAILFETGAFRNFDFNILVVAPRDLRISRIMKRDNATEEQIISRMNNQWDDEKKIPLTDYVIQNADGDNLEAQIKMIITNLEHKL